MIRTPRAIVFAIAALSAVLVLSGCTNGVSGNATTDPDTAKIGLLLPDSVTARYDSADRPYFEARIGQLCPGCHVLYGNADGDAAKQQQQAESMLTQGVQVLVLDPYDGKAAASIVGLAAARGVPVISYDRLIDSPDISYYISFDNELVGRLQAQALVERLQQLGIAPGDGGILMVNGSPTDNNASQFKKGAHEVIDASGYTVLAEFDTPGWDPAKAQDWVAGQITQYGSRIVGVYAANDPTAGGAIASLKAAGVLPLPPVTGQDAELAGLQRILTGDQYMTVYKALRPEAERAADLAIDLVNGRSPDGEVEVSIGSETVRSFLLEPVAVTRDRIGPVVLGDGFFTVTQLCTPDYAAACTAAGLT
ncbi:ABC transporter substrate-binding protein [Protaetiibacter mangrovi]|uniref:Sugar ABC transporter substrate-binding protein n=1 Tax=Protaetiibacter mangrovi TaxID=2970926 RepID=A0ABT1ZCA1_9MICO|nr:sugar ABC transporter substrate-binding protein [Protaetiibacter mangrovi]MCS0498338.1 sugar ABC transporter substrate-binding protein [Protaetiibacter mangrovi]TPX02694.1 sugar ABC transporter substrate-binding protein [Schumannella luteola]